MVETMMMRPQRIAGHGIPRTIELEPHDCRDRRYAGMPANGTSAVALAGVLEDLAPAGHGETGNGIWKLGSFALYRVDTHAARYRRSAAQISRDLLDDWLVCVATRGMHGVRGGDSRLTVPPLVPVILSLGEPFETELFGGEWLCLVMPRDSCPELAPAIERCRVAPLASASGRILGGFLQRIAAELPNMREAEIPRAVEATRALVSAAVSAATTPGLVDDAVVRAARLARVRAIIRQHLRSPDLTPEFLCRLVGISRSRLYRLFEPVGGVVRDIQRERLRQAHRAIADPTDSRTIQVISEELGFLEPTTFSRAFRREFGYAPGALRRVAPPEHRPRLEVMAPALTT
ncbi:helix-turn-helix domain-containing protein [Falsiroseomonas tokyonensis]|uniref:Helix-turn-helix domain-containing protein n=2 Tax=Falsiroseomonas tokyonensis TaxID=430521 RepID=A0ABV7BZD7_9PROT|nr:helix-turn-helix transcriptional regulator [Falsiroseomonas tokyonensis]